MKADQRILARLAIGALLAGAAFAWTQDEGGMQMPVPKPGPEHEVIAQLEGTWDAAFEIMGQTSHGTMKNEMAMGGLWLVQDYEGEMMGQGFTGLGLLGYDPQKKLYLGTWVDSMTTSMSLAEGMYDKAKKELVLSMEGPNPMTGETVVMRQITRFKDKDHWEFAMAAPGPDGKYVDSFVIEYTRKK